MQWEEFTLGKKRGCTSKHLEDVAHWEIKENHNVIVALFSLAQLCVSTVMDVQPRKQIKIFSNYLWVILWSYPKVGLIVITVGMVKPGERRTHCTCRQMEREREREHNTPSADADRYPKQMILTPISMLTWIKNPFQTPLEIWRLALQSCLDLNLPLCVTCTLPASLFSINEL